MTRSRDIVLGITRRQWADALARLTPEATMYDRLDVADGMVMTAVGEVAWDDDAQADEYCDALTAVGEELALAQSVPGHDPYRSVRRRVSDPHNWQTEGF